VNTQVIFESLFSLTDLKYVNGMTFWDYVGINAEPVCVEFRNFVQCLTLVSYSTSFLLIVCNSFAIGMIMA
jgi:hypothetical protein